MGSSKLVGSYSGSGKVTQVDKYGNVTCETVCVILKVSKTCAKDSVYLINVQVGSNVNNALIVKESDSDSSLWFGVGEGVTQFLDFNTSGTVDEGITRVDYSFSSYISGNHEMWSAGEFTLKPCKCYKKDKCGCDCETH